ncbi:non-specific lipid-transfer protein A-like [Quercus lobata]|uniref:non-specific lipid-transfer protein A-like n=1 Tax=Quercus lobata TaxID=97700 RepID=UPI00124617BC|nr:non-specific lipid-transfer protein A-like [Quercus lobata]
MEKKIMSCSVLAFGLMIILVLNASATAADGITCEEALTQLITCQPYFLGFGSKPSRTCCKGAENISQQANTTTIRRSLCECFENAAKAFQLIPERLKQLPQLCKIQVPVPLDPTVDCNTVP